jgi:hypothetical protein
MMASSSNSVYYKLFNGQVSELLQELMQVCPTTIKIKEASIMFDVARNLDPNMPLDTFVKTVMPTYGDLLRNHTESFFMSHDFRDDLTAATATNKGFSSWNALVDTLRGMWQTKMNEDSKQAMWKYIDNLMALADRVVEVSRSY